MIGSLDKYILYGACFVGALCIGCSSVSCRDHDSSQYDFESKLRLAIQETVEGETNSFTMRSLTDFSWDGLYIFGPYTSTDDIDKALGFSWQPAKDSGIDWSDTFCLLVFTHRNSVVRYYEYPRRDGDWFALSSTKKIAPSSAVFSVRRGKSGFPVVTKE